MQKKAEASPDDDNALFALVGQSRYAYYVGTPGIAAGVGDSPHGFEMVLFNTTSQATLETTEKLPAGSSFPTGSVIAKEIYALVIG